MRVLVLCLLVGVIQCTEDLRCEVSDRYACRNLYTATECGVYDKCLLLWTSSKWGSVKKDTSSKCEFCIRLANQHSDVTSMSSLCEEPFKSQAQNDKCLNFLALWGKKNFEHIDENAFCNILDWCDSHKYIGAIDFASSVCEDCKKVVQDVRALVADNATADAISNKLNVLLCDPLPAPFRDYCKETVVVHVPVVLHLIELQIVPDEICALLSLCPQSKPYGVALSDLLPRDFLLTPDSAPTVPVTHTKCQEKKSFSWINRPSSTGHAFWTSLNRLSATSAVGVPTLKECVAVLEQFRAALNDQALREEIKTDIEQKVCSTLPSFLRSACISAVNVHFDDIISSLNNANLSEVCATFGMKDVTLADANVIGEKQTLLNPGLPLPGVCQLCEIVVNRVMNLFLQNVTEASITRALENVCSLLPSSYQTKCDTFVEQYGAKIVDAIIEGTAPKLICFSIGLCGPIPELTVPIMPAAPEPVSLPVGPLGLSYCDSCKLFVSVIQQQLANNNTQAQIEAMVDRMCKVLPGSYADECINLVKSYLPIVLDYIAKDMSAADICQEIGLCNARLKSDLGTDRIATMMCSSNDLNFVCGSIELATKCNKAQECLAFRLRKYLLKSMNLDSPEPTQDCSVCSKMLSSWRSVRQVTSRLFVNYKQCSAPTDPVDRQQCRLVVDKQAAILPELIGTNIKEEDLCKKLQLCRQVTASKLDMPDASINSVASSCKDPRFWCTSKRSAQLCGRVKFCEDLLSKPTTGAGDDHKDIFGINACEWGPTYYCQSKERALACGETAFNYCRDEVWAKEDPVLKTEAELLGVNPCTWGPSYWCASDGNARSCGSHAVETCRLLSMQKVASTA